MNFSAIFMEVPIYSLVIYRLAEKHVMYICMNQIANEELIQRHDPVACTQVTRKFPFLLFHVQPVAAGCIIAGSMAVPLMQCHPISSKLVLILPTLEG